MRASFDARSGSSLVSQRHWTLRRESDPVPRLLAFAFVRVSTVENRRADLSFSLLGDKFWGRAKSPGRRTTTRVVFDPAMASGSDWRARRERVGPEDGRPGGPALFAWGFVRGGRSVGNHPTLPRGWVVRRAASPVAGVPRAPFHRSSLAGGHRPAADPYRTRPAGSWLSRETSPRRLPAAGTWRLAYGRRPVVGRLRPG